jgi:CRISPR-associated protein Csx10
VSGLPRAFPVRVQVLSDWMVGTGEGRVGEVDATVRRDGDGLPFVPAKTLTGIWRDACEQVAGWLGGGDGEENRWLPWVDWVFGSQPDRASDRAARAHRAPQPAVLALSPARLPGPVRAACRGRPALQAAAVLLRPGVAIDDETGTARDDMLRLEERARPATLEASAEFALSGDGDLPRAAELLLRAGAAAVDGLGGKRNRGAGRCWILLPGMPGFPSPAIPPGSQATAPDSEATPPGGGIPVAPVPAAPRPPDERLAELAADMTLLDEPGTPPPPPGYAARLAAPVPAAPAGAADSERVIHRVTMEVLTPLVAQRRVLGNVVMSLESVPGSVLLPEILARLDRQAGHRDLVVGDARPAARDEASAGAIAGLPVPMVWHRPKDRHKNDVVNVAQSRPGPAERRQPMRSGHVAPAGPGAWHLLAPAMAVSTHAVIDDDAGRPTPDRGGVFSYLGLAPGTLLVSDIVLAAGVGLRLAAGDRLRLGRSRKDDFGLVRVLDVRQVTACGVPDVAAGAPVRVWCVSDVLLRDGWGAPDPSPRALAAELARRLGVPVGLAGPAPGGLVTQAYRAARRESFHARWGRPRPSLVGLAAGSVVTVQAGGDVPGAVLAAVQRDGVGERTAEGFGQVRFDAPEVTVAAPGLTPLAAVAAPDAPPEGPLPPVPDAMERAAVAAEVARRVAAAVGGGVDAIVPGASRVSSRAQWGSLRQQAVRLRTPGGRDAVAVWFAHSREVRQRRVIWGLAALEALERLLTSDTEIWRVLGLDGAGLDPFVLAPDRAGPLREALRLDAVITLITEISRDATLASQTGAEARQ